MTGNARAGWPIVPESAHGPGLAADGGRADGIALRLLGMFDLSVHGESVPLGVTAQRLLTVVAVSSGRVPRARAAGILWPNAGSARAAANLRSALWRLQQLVSNVIDASLSDLRLAAGVGVDLYEVSRVAYGLTDTDVEPRPEQLGEAVRCNLYEDITSGIGDDDWSVAERERFRRLRVHALEALAGRLVAVGWYGAAIEAALGAMRADPFRESAHRLLVEAHLAEGSRFEARRYHRSYQDLLRKELGLTPSAEFMRLLRENEPDRPPTLAR